MAEASAVSPRLPRKAGNSRQPRDTTKRSVAAIASQRQGAGFRIDVTDARVGVPSSFCTFWRREAGARSYSPARWVDEWGVSWASRAVMHSAQEIKWRSKSAARTASSSPAGEPWRTAWLSSQLTAGHPFFFGWGLGEKSRGRSETRAAWIPAQRPRHRHGHAAANAKG